MGSYINKNVKDTSVTLLKFKKILKLIFLCHGYIHIRIKEMVVIGEKGMIVFADVLENEKKLMFYNHNISWKGELPIITKAKGKNFI